MAQGTDQVCIMDTEDRGRKKDGHDEDPQASPPPEADGQEGPDSASGKPRKLRRIRGGLVGSTGPQDASKEPSHSDRASQEIAPGRGRTYMHFFHFDTRTGKVVYIEDNKSAFGAVCECHKCGTAMQFEAEACPVCGTRLDEGDCGIVALLGETGLDWLGTQDLDCPHCGEHVKLERGACPECGSSINPPGRAASEDETGRLVSAQNVVFLHLDVESGEVEYLQRLEGNRGLGHMAVRLKDEDPNGSAEG